MSEIGFSEVREAQRKERHSPTLTKLDPNFYKKLAEAIRESTRQYKEQGSASKLRETENITKLAKDLFECREQKILMKALRASRTKTSKQENLTPEEKKIYKTVLHQLEENHAFLEKVLKGEYSQKSSSSSSSSQGNSKNILNQEKHKLVLVRALKEIPSFVGRDSQEYGPFKPGDVVKLPPAEVKLLLQQNLVEEM